MANEDETQVRAEIAAERRDLADVRAALPAERWDEATLCAAGGCGRLFRQDSCRF